MKVRAALTVGLSFSVLLAFLLLLSSAVPSAQAEMPLRATPTLPVHIPETQRQESDPAQITYPDLVITNLEVTSPTLVGRPVEIRITIVNSGTVNLISGNNFLVDLYIDPPEPPQPGIPGQPGDVTFGVQYFLVPPGQEYTIVYSTVFTDVGGHTLWAQIDTDGVVVETDEYNNIFGPVPFQVTTSRRFLTDSHEDFQSGFSNLDTSNPYGLLRSYTRWFRAPDVAYTSPYTPSFYDPDNRISPLQYVPFTSTTTITDRANQIQPQLAAGPNQELFAVWEDGRNGEIFNRDVYFARSLDYGLTWSTPVRVNQDPITNTANQLNPTMVYDPFSQHLFVFWQDNRLGAYDIWMARSTDLGNSWVELLGHPINNDYQIHPTVDQYRPTAWVERIEHLERSRIYVAWEDRRNGNSDIFFSQADVEAVETAPDQAFLENVFVTDDPRTTQQTQSAPAISASGEVVFLVWQDSRNSSVGDPADIFYTFGQPSLTPDPSGSYTFDIDRRVNDDELGPGQYTPAVSAEEYIVVIPREYTDPENDDTVVCHPIYSSVTAVIAWQDWRENNQPDIYSAAAFVNPSFLGRLDPTYEDPDICLSEDAFEEFASVDSGEVQDNVKVNEDDTFLPIEGCLAPDAPDPWEVEPSWQGEPSVAAADTGVMIAWSDARNHDQNNYDIFTAETYALPLNRPIESREIDLADWTIRVVQNNLHRQAFLEDGRFFLENHPAAARQNNPSLIALDARTLHPDDPIFPAFFVAWDDNRNDIPFTGYTANRDIFTTQRSYPALVDGLPQNVVTDTGRGIYISPVFDAGGESVWYDIEWWGVTQFNASIRLQTRFGLTATPPKGEVAENGWSAWTGIGGENGYYSAPGQHIRGAEGNLFPRSRYIQFRVLLNENIPPDLFQPNFSCISEISLNYELGAPTIYIPIIMKQARPEVPTRIPNDPMFERFQWNLLQIEVPEVWIFWLGTGRNISVLDSGLDVGHPEFAGKLLSGYDFVQRDTDVRDENGHGTHIAGVAGAYPDNGVGIAGVGWDARLRPVRVLNELGEGDAATVAEAIRWAVDQGDHIINLSLSGPVDSGALRDAVLYAHGRNALVVASVGDDALTGGQTPFPASIAGVVGVGASTNERRRANYSNIGPWVDLIAPGGEATSVVDPTFEHWIWSTWPRYFGTGVPAIGYNSDTGTGQAAAHVSGVAALVWSVNRNLAWYNLHDILRETAEDFGPAGPDLEYGYGLLDAPAAVLRARSTLKQPPIDRLRVGSSPELYPPQVVAGYRPGQLIVAMHADAAKDLPEIAEKWALKVQRQFTDDSFILSVPEGQEQVLAQQLADDPRVRYAEPNYILKSH